MMIHSKEQTPRSESEQTIILPMQPLYRRLIRLASLMLVLAGASAPGLVMWQAFTGQISKFSLIVLIAGFPYLVLCLFCSHLLARFLKFNQLEIDALGLRWCTPFFRVETTWDNLKGLPDAQERPGLVGLLTREPVALTGLGPFTLLPRQLRGFPTGCFGELDQGPLGQALLRFAPAWFHSAGQAVQTSSQDETQD